MNLNEINDAFRTGKLTQTQALTELGKLLKAAPKKQVAPIMKVMDEVLGMESEPRPMSTSERESAERWEKGYRGDDK